MLKKKFDLTYISILICTLTVFVLIILYANYFDDFIKIPKCFFYKIFKIYCPGCGATRAVYSLLEGKILQSIYYNAFIVYLVVVDFGYLITEGLAKILRKENIFFIKNINVYLWGGVIILGISWGFKLIMLYCGIKV